MTVSAINPTPVTGFQLGTPPIYYDVATTATWMAPAMLCLNDAGAGFADPATLQLLHFVDGVWYDATRSHDPATQTICASVASFSPFAVALPPNDLPTITGVLDQAVPEDIATAAPAFTVGDIETAAADLTVSGTTSNQALVPMRTSFLAAPAQAAVTVTPAAGQSGVATITLARWGRCSHEDHDVHRDGIGPAATAVESIATRQAPCRSILPSCQRRAWESDPECRVPRCIESGSRISRVSMARTSSRSPVLAPSLSTLIRRTGTKGHTHMCLDLVFPCRILVNTTSRSDVS